MRRVRHGFRFASRLALAAACIVSMTLPIGGDPLRPQPADLASAPADLIDRMRADPFAYFRFINRAWTTRVCEALADVTDPPIVRLHGDAHVEQFALTDDAWGLDDFDDSASGPAFVDIVRFLGSLDLAARQRGWASHRDALWSRFFDGYRRGLSDPAYRPPEPDLVRLLRTQSPVTRAAHLAWGEQRMQPMEPSTLKTVVSALEVLERQVHAERPDLASGFFGLVRAGWLRLGIGSAPRRKVLMRVQGPTADPGDDMLIEAKEVSNLGGVSCLDDSTRPHAIRVIQGTRQLGRLKHEILAMGSTRLIPGAADRGEDWLEWWVSSWEPSYRELQLGDLRSVDDLSDIAFDSGVQLGAGKVVAVRTKELSSVTALESRLQKETTAIIDDMLAGWREFAASTTPVRSATPATFTATPIVTGLGMGYQLVVVDLNRDRRLDVIVVDERADTLAWYENPSWQRHVLATDVPRTINLDWHDLDADGIPEIALAHRFETNPDKSVGQLLLLTHDGDPRQPWRPRDIGRVPTAHRVRWMPVVANEAPWLIVAPFAGEGVYAPDYQGTTPIYAYRPADWERRTISTTSHGILHSIHPVEWAPGQWQLLTASFDGLRRLAPRAAGDWTQVPIHAGNPEPCPRCGTSEVKVGVLGSQRFLATIEPFHGNQLAVYLEQSSGWDRRVLDDRMTNGHALAVGDVDGDGRDEIVASFRGKDVRVEIWAASVDRGSQWTRTVLDEGHVAGADCKIADITGDGRPDIACSGASTGNVMLFERTSPR